MKTVCKMLLRWEQSGDRMMFCECKPDSVDWPCWSYLGFVAYLPGNWITRLLWPRRFMAYASGAPADARFATLEEAKEWVEDNAVWP